MISPLKIVVSFLGMIWYGFTDLLALTPGTWKKNMTLRYRVARLCCCHLDTGTDSSLPLQLVNPEHIKHSSLRRDLKWFGRILVLVVLSGQYVQAGFILARRILSDTAATIDYAMSFLVLSGLIGLFRSLMVSLVHSAWRLDPEFLPFVEKQCQLRSCKNFKDQQGFPNRTRFMIYGYNVSNKPRIVLDWQAAGYAQLQIVLNNRRGMAQHIFAFYGIMAYWYLTIYALVRWSDKSRSDGIDRKPEETSIPASNPIEEGLPAPVAPDFQEIDRARVNSSFIWTIFRWIFLLVRCLYPALVSLSTTVQFFYILGPCVGTYWIIVYQTTGWNNINGTTPCQHLWKDSLEDELWWF
ncbi:hypothetical protein HBH70_231740 [Parastagonospora nodorum]|nr:hypothetical protein HBI09_224530 [Parastagonospora nodorum]KAH4056742.1 hypothetical protein HBH50_239720 [Parastagonospora nodorum]KAH4077787.1 hypothetical protein HBH48_237380 [Parastagonospora nodorum]KAH4215827.1 hypothetical protein HBI06_240550 [Parastagonospora nodorum]KAH4225316.1 hypothetical protein HBI05_229770 [Parastagonospora nodorum]